MAVILDLHHTGSSISLTSIASFTANTDTQVAYREFCKYLHHIGVTEDMIDQKENEILDALRSQEVVTTKQFRSS